MNLPDKLELLDVLLCQTQFNPFQLTADAMDAACADPARSNTAAANFEASADKAERSMADARRALRSIVRGLVLEDADDIEEASIEKPVPPSGNGFLANSGSTWNTSLLT